MSNDPSNILPARDWSKRIMWPNILHLKGGGGGTEKEFKAILLKNWKYCFRRILTVNHTKNLKTHRKLSNYLPVRELRYCCHSICFSSSWLSVSHALVFSNRLSFASLLPLLYFFHFGSGLSLLPETPAFSVISYLWIHQHPWSD